MSIKDFGIGSMIRVYVDNHCQSGPLKIDGILKVVNNDNIIISKQDTIYCPNDSRYHLAMVTIDSSYFADTMIFTNKILACEYISFYSFVGEENRGSYLVEYEEYIADVKKSLDRKGHNPQELHYFTEDGFCIKGK